MPPHLHNAASAMWSLVGRYRPNPPSCTRVFVVLLYVTVFAITLILSLSYLHLTNEDAWISYKYARNLAQGHGLVSNPGESPQEGYSNLTLVLVLALLTRLFHFDPLYTSKAVGILSILGTLALSHYLVKMSFDRIKTDVHNEGQGAAGDELVPRSSLHFHVSSVGLMLSIGLSNYFNLWATSGLETTLYSLILLSIFYLTTYLLLTQKYKYLWVVGMLSFVSLNTRPEGLMNLAVFLSIVIFWMSINRKMDKLLVRHTLVSVVVFSTVAISLILFKINYFGDFVSNPSYVKLALRNWSEPCRYLREYFEIKGIGFSALFIVASVSSMVFVSLGMYRARNKKESLFLFAALLFLGSQTFFIYYVGGDYMSYSRFVVPHYPIMAALAVLFPSIMAGSWRCPRHVDIAITAVVVAILSYSALVDEKIPDPRWWDRGFIPPNKIHEYDDSVYHRATLYVTRKVRRGEYYATGEFGYIPYHVDAKGLDMIGLNQKEIARSHKYYGLDEVFYASRDFILSKKPKLIFVSRHYKDSDGNVMFDPAVAWFFKGYYESEFFRKNYSGNPPDEIQRAYDDFTFYEWNGTYQAGDRIVWSDRSLRDKLMYGFYPEENQMWAGPLARVLLKFERGDRYLRLRGYIPDITSYRNSENVIEIKCNDDAVGDRTVAKTVIRRSGFFEARFKVDGSTFRDSEESLVTIKGSEVVREPKSLDKRRLSYIFTSIRFSRD